MRNHRDVIENVFQRRDKYQTEQKQKRRKVIKIGAFTVCFCLITLVGFEICKGNLFQKSSAAAEERFVSDTVKHDNNKYNAKENIIKINEISDSASADRKKMNICLFTEDRVELSLEEATSYYGTNICPEVPQDLTAWESQDKFEIYKRDGGVGEVYYDVFILNYSNKDFTRSVNIEGCKGKLPPSCIANWEFEDFEISKINGEKVFIALDKDTGYYFAEFMYKNVGFRIIIEGLNEDEIVSVISSLIK